MTRTNFYLLVRILLLLVTTVFWGRSTSAQTHGLSLFAEFPANQNLQSGERPVEAVRVFIEHSKNGNYIARCQLADRWDAAATVQIFEFDAKLRSYHFHEKLRLPNSRGHQLLLTNDGRYLVALSLIFPKETTSNALVIYDLQENKSRSFALADFLPEATLAKLESDKMMTIIPWFKQVKLVDEEHKLYVNPDSTSTLKFPSVLVDLQAMTATWIPPSTTLPSAAPQPERQQSFLEYQTQDLKKQEPQIRIISEDPIQLLRIEPGHGNKKAVATGFRYVADKNDYEKNFEISLNNPVAPEFARVSYDGNYMVTMDDIQQLGTTGNALVIYDIRNQKRRSFSLEDFLTQQELDQLSTLGGFRHWRNLNYACSVLSDSGLQLFTNRHQNKLFPDVVVDLEKMEVRRRTKEELQHQESRELFPDSPLLSSELDNKNVRSAQQIGEDLAKAFNGKSDYAGAFSLLREAERVRSPDLIPQLLEIAEKESKLEHNGLAFRALHVADASGDIEEKLWTYAKDYKQNVLLASNAIHILGRAADEETIKKLAPFNLVKSKGNWIQAAFSGAERVRNLQIKIEKLEEPDQKLKLALDNFLSNWNLIEDAPPTMDRCTRDPLAAWSQRNLLRLSQQHPQLAAKTVFTRDDYRKDANEEVNLAYRKFVARFLAPSSRAEFDKLFQNANPDAQ